MINGRTRLTWPDQQQEKEKSIFHLVCCGQKIYFHGNCFFKDISTTDSGKFFRAATILSREIKNCVHSVLGRMVGRPLGQLESYEAVEYVTFTLPSCSLNHPCFPQLDGCMLYYRSFLNYAEKYTMFLFLLLY